MEDVADKLKRLAGRQTMRLTHYGRKSGKPYEVTIWFAVARDTVYLATANVNRQWVRNVKKTPRVKLTIGGEMFEGEARFLEGPAERERVTAMMKRKYWLFLPVFVIGQLLSVAGIMKDKTGAFEVRLA
jgi:deazaflavin-dependent oxidoreductase (nitroreductase family)